MDDLTPWTHEHRFETGGERSAERRTGVVVALTVATMVAEIAAGTAFNSMALLADGFHMATHAFALGIAVSAYAFARKHATDTRFSFGTGKFGALAGFTSALILGVVALLMVWESGARLLSPQSIAFTEALVVAVVGLVVNLASAAILGQHDHHADHHDDPHGHGHADGHHHHDHNLRAAYIHVVADALTSVLAIAALLAGMTLGWWWMDPMMGLVGAAVISVWAVGLARRTGMVLLDMSHDPAVEAEIRALVEAEDTRVSDLHVWQIGPGHWAAIVSVVTRTPRPPEHYRALLAPVHELSHVTVEVHPFA
ncbi:MAG: CDF family Co(II)/Ni(II) efflux transporter DmeF [Solirubrobacterales bacterium]